VAWEALARDYKSLFGAPVKSEACRVAWARLANSNDCLGAAAVVEGELVGLAHVVTHPFLWGPTALYLIESRQVV